MKTVNTKQSKEAPDETIKNEKKRRKSRSFRMAVIKNLKLNPSSFVYKKKRKSKMRKYSYARETENSLNTEADTEEKIKKIQLNMLHIPLGLIE